MFEVKLPVLGQSVEEASIVDWLKREGDPVAEGEPLFTVQTDKAELEVEAPASGILRKILIAPGVDVPVLTVVAWIGEANEALPDRAPVAQPAQPGQKKAVSAPALAPAPAAAAAPDNNGGRLAVSPRARRAAEDHGIALEGLAGSGAQGRVVESDVLAEAASQPRATPVAKRLAADAGVPLKAIAGSGPQGKVMKGDVEAALSGGGAARPAAPAAAGRVALTPMRRIIAERMAASKYSAPHYYVTVEIDMSAAKKLRASLPYKVSFNDLVLRACTLALREFPAVNARWQGDAIEQLAEVHLGVAVALDEGLVVPVVKNAERRSLEDLAQESRRLAEAARTRKLGPDAYTGSTFTVSNLGVFGVDDFTAIINLPDSAILAVGQMKDRPVVIDGGIHVRPIMKATLSSDHRVIDGALAARFMGRVRELLEAAALA